MVLRVVTPPNRLPFIKTYEDGHREGLLMDMLPKLLETAGINDTVNFLLAKDNNPDGFIDAFNEDQADLALYPVIIGKGIQAQAQQTAAFLNGGLQLLVRKKERDSDQIFTFLAPFSAYLWICIICSALAVFVVWIIIGKLSPLGTYTVRRMRRIDSPDEEVKEFAIESATESFLLEAWMALVGQALIPRGRSWAVWIVSLSWGLFGVIVLSAYTANLAAILADGNFDPAISNVADLLRVNGTAAVLKGGQNYAYVRTTGDPALQLLQPNIVQSPTYDIGYDWVQSGEIDALIAPDSYLLPYMARPPCNTQVVGPYFGIGSMALAVPLNSTLLTRINTAIYRLGETGYIDGLYTKWIIHSDTCEMPSVVPQVQAPQLGISAFRGLWYMLFAFMVLAFIHVGLENLLIMVLHRRPKLRAKVEHLMEKVIGDGSSVFEEEKARDEEKIPPSKTSPAVSSPPETSGATNRRTADDMKSEEAGDAVLNSLKLARWY
ncbi:hypothetical protein CVIRNUC_010437 [Coccomyxa viridis]|uniref:Ionotropic glutamate receptor C-terminal domain-containing protein n=1 Tax=Coccomyxa viridis TaxID=1274662 RepID=A0AAV1IKR2_9CHLO|nr:hypothetical protein CVIRNUC_010437 [Coccomyxa viridis]